MPTRRSWLALTPVLFWLSVSFAPARAADAYLSKPVRLLVAFAPGGPTDILARVLAASMARHLGQAVVVDNKPGAGGALGTKEAARAAADGYTLLFAGDASLTVQPQLFKTAGYDALRDFAPVRMVASQRNVLMANRAQGFTDLKSFIARARAQPRAVSFGSAGNGSPSHLIGALFESESGINLLHIPYRGAGPAMTDLIGGQVHAMFVGMPVALQNAPRGGLAMLAVTGDKRDPALPQVPTFSELGIPGLGNDTAAWWAVMVPASTPPQLVQALDKALAAALADAGTRHNLEAQGVQVLNQDGKAVVQRLRADQAKWARLIKQKNITE